VASVRYVLVALRPGVAPAAYEGFWRESDRPLTTSLASVVRYSLHRVTEPPGIAGGPWDYLERFEVTDRRAFEREASAAGTALVETLYGRFLDRAKTVAFWVESVD
jgi:hypothetical protein